MRLWKHSNCFCGKNDCKVCKDDHVVKLSIMALYVDGRTQALLHDFKE